MSSAKDIHYVKGIPRKPLPAGKVLVHNHVSPQLALGLNGFRAWTQTLDNSLAVCDCNWAGMVHYRMACKDTEEIKAARST